MQKWSVEDWSVAGQYLGCRVIRYENGESVTAHAVIAKDSGHPSQEEQSAARVECTFVAKFLNRFHDENGVDLIMAADVLRNVSHAFPHFQNGEEVTPDAVRKIGVEFTQMQMDPGPSEIVFSDDDGIERRIVYEHGDESVGVRGGWVLAETPIAA